MSFFLLLGNLLLNRLLDNLLFDGLLLSLGLEGSSLVGNSLGVHLGVAGSLGLGLVDGLHENSLVLVHVTLGLEVEGAVQVLVDLFLLAVLAEETTEHAQTADPEELAGHTSLAGTLAGARAHVTAFALGLVHLADTGHGVHADGLGDDETVLDELADVAAGVCKGDLADLAGVEPHSLLADAEDAGCESLLELEGHHLLLGWKVNEVRGNLYLYF